MSQISFSDLVNRVVPDASDFNDRFNALKNRINNGMESDNIATGAITNAKLGADSVDASKLDETDDYTWTGAHDFSGSSITGVATGLQGSYKNLSIIRPLATTVDVDADLLIVWNTSSVAKILESVNLTIDITASGANGLDTGSEASNTWYYIWVIYNGTTAAGLISTSSTAPTMPSGYTYKALVGAVRNDGSSDFIDFKQNGLDYYFSAWTAIASGNVGASQSITISSLVPSALSTIARGTLGVSNGYVSISNLLANVGDATTITGNKFISADVNTSLIGWELNVLTADTLYWCSGYASGAVYITGFKINKLG